MTQLGQFTTFTNSFGRDRRYFFLMFCNKYDKKTLNIHLQLNLD